MPLEMSKEPEVTEVESGTVVFVCADGVILKNESKNTTKGGTKGL
jgi:hypothetical protein